MPTKIFTTFDLQCPFGENIAVDSVKCRQCPHYYRAGTGMFFWCKHPVPESTKTGTQPKKKGRPRVKAKIKPVKTRKKKNG